MILYLFITALTVGMGYFINADYTIEYGVGTGQYKNRQQLLNKTLLFGIFMILFLLSALRIGIGNDYWTYRYEFLDILRGDTKVSFEIGFQWLVYILQTLFGQDNYRIVFAVMAFMTCGLFVKGLYRNADWFVMTFFLFMANGFYFMSFSNVRYYFAFAVCIYAMQYVFCKDYPRFILWIVFAAFFHKTVLVVIPAYLVAYYLKWTKKTVWLIPAAIVGLVAGKSIIRKLIFILYPYYEGNAFDNESISYVNVAKCVAILAFCLFFYGKTILGDAKAEMLFNLNLFATLLYTFGYYIPETSRICYYLVVGQVFLVPLILRKLWESGSRWRYIWIPVVVAYMGYFLFFLERGKSDYVMILPYMTWIFT